MEAHEQLDALLKAGSAVLHEVPHQVQSSLRSKGQPPLDSHSFLLAPLTSEVSGQSRMAAQAKAGGHLGVKLEIAYVQKRMRERPDQLRGPAL